jgi:uncharacterized repeat protein (TIGR03847 family)
LSSRSFDIDVEAIAVGTQGPPGRREFFLQARGAGETVTLACEKTQVAALVQRIDELLAAQGLDPVAGRRSGVRNPLQAEWRVGEIGLGFHEGKQRFVVVARELTEEQGHEAAATARFWIRPEQVRAFARQAEEIVAAGRRPCPRCGLPMDPAGHPCPAANGTRPIF